MTKEGPEFLLNQDVKSNALGRRRARDEKELMSNTRRSLRSRQRKPEIVKKEILPWPTCPLCSMKM